MYLPPRKEMRTQRHPPFHPSQCKQKPPLNRRALAHASKAKGSNLASNASKGCKLLQSYYSRTPSSNTLPIPRLAYLRYIDTYPRTSTPKLSKRRVQTCLIIHTYLHTNIHTYIQTIYCRTSHSTPHPPPKTTPVSPMHAKRSKGI